MTTNRSDGGRMTYLLLWLLLSLPTCLLVGAVIAAGGGE